MSYPVIRILPGHDRRLRGGGPWLFSNEVQMDKAAKALEPGSLVRLVSHDGKAMALAQFNPHSLICARVLTRNTEAVIDARFFVRRLERALALRSRLFERPFYRLVHAEADGFPGVIVDRYGD
ncbi:MAG: RlmI/RlmK family 23S rRNA methyltransferase, partial [Geminicoccaceae bacterium]|nr:RlmI/RlmK family 23S rRNA methyltransferase [Geminicoccaceae bacterium]